MFARSLRLSNYFSNIDNCTTFRLCSHSALVANLIYSFKHRSRQKVKIINIILCFRNDKCYSRNTHSAVSFRSFIIVSCLQGFKRLVCTQLTNGDRHYQKNVHIQSKHWCWLLCPNDLLCKMNELCCRIFWVKNISPFQLQFGIGYTRNHYFHFISDRTHDRQPTALVSAQLNIDRLHFLTLWIRCWCFLYGRSARWGQSSQSD